MPSAGRVQKSRIEIPLPSKPRPYRPGDGPPSAPITLALKNDSDAFIVDKRVLAGKPVHGELKLEMWYVVGWPDLPAGRVVINAKQICDYVSPRTLEDFEYNLLLEREREEREEEERKQQAEVEAAKAKANALQPISESASATIPKTSAPTANGKKRGRPSKADLLAQRLAKEVSVDQNAEVSLPPTSTSGPSLSTPKKKKLLAAVASAPASEQDTDAQDDLGDEGDVDMMDDMTDPSAAIYQQLYSEASSVVGGKADPGESTDEISSRTPWPYATTPKRPANAKSQHSTSSPSLLQVEIKSQNQSSFASAPRTAPVQRTTLQHYGFTPAARSSGKWPSNPSSPGPGTTPTTTKAAITNSIPINTTKTPTADSKPRRKRKRTSYREEEQGEEPAWEVERLEGDYVEEHEDKSLSRYFKVRWKGNWPPDENPTWEPEENIPRKLVKEYLRRKARKSSGGGGAAAANRPSRDRETPRALVRPPPPVRKYSSVSEAFEGEIDELATGGDSKVSRVSSAAKYERGRSSDPDDGEGLDLVTYQHPTFDDGEDELLVVTEQSHQRASSSIPAPVRTQFGTTFSRNLVSAYGSGGTPSEYSLQHRPPHQNRESESSGP